MDRHFKLSHWTKAHDQAVFNSHGLKEIAIDVQIQQGFTPSIKVRCDNLKCI